MFQQLASAEASRSTRQCGISVVVIRRTIVLTRRITDSRRSLATSRDQSPPSPPIKLNGVVGCGVSCRSVCVANQQTKRLMLCSLSVGGLAARASDSGVGFISKTSALTHSLTAHSLVRLLRSRRDNRTSSVFVVRPRDQRYTATVTDDAAQKNAAYNICGILRCCI